MTYNPDHPIYTAVFFKDGTRQTLSALRWQKLVSKCAEAGVFDVDLATEANAEEGYCLNITADFNQSLFPYRPQIVGHKEDGACMYGQDRAAWMAGVGRYGND